MKKAPDVVAGEGARFGQQVCLRFPQFCVFTLLSSLLAPPCSSSASHHLLVAFAPPQIPLSLHSVTHPPTPYHYTRQTQQFEGRVNRFLSFARPSPRFVLVPNRNHLLPRFATPLSCSNHDLFPFPQSFLLVALWQLEGLQHCQRFPQWWGNRLVSSTRGFGHL